jgi:hypothetical protein
MTGAGPACDPGFALAQVNFRGHRDLGQLLDSMDHFMRELKPMLT